MTRGIKIPEYLKQAVERAEIDPAAFPKRRRISELDPEELLQRSVWEWWLLVGQKAYPMVGMRHVPNGGKRSKAAAGRLKAMGVEPGVADLHLTLSGGQTGWLELKRPEIRDAAGKIIQTRGVQSKAQLVFQKSEIKLGALYAICDSLEQVIAKLSEWTGLPPAGIGRVKPPAPAPKPANELDPVALLMAGE
jgi:hypothetical protein